MKGLHYIVRPLSVSLAVLALSLGFASCNGIEYDGEYNKDGYYTGNAHIYFDFKSAADTVQLVEMGHRDPAESTYKVELPLRVTGVASSQPRRFRVEVISEETTAVEGLHYRISEDEFIIKADSVKGVLPITFLRDAFPQDADIQDAKERAALLQKELSLRLVEANELGVRVSTRKVRLVATNESLEPDWWRMYFYAQLGPFDPYKYGKILAPYGYDASKFLNEFASSKHQEILGFLFELKKQLEVDPNYPARYKARLKEWKTTNPFE